MHRRDIIKISLLGILGSSALSSCATAEPGKSSQNDIPGKLAQDERLVRDQVSQRLRVIDIKAKKISWEEKRPQEFQYWFPKLNSSVFTSGDSNKGNFRCFSVEGGRIRKLLDLPEGEGLFPFAEISGDLLFLKAKYSKENLVESQSLCRLEGQSLVEVEELPASISAIPSTGNKTIAVDSSSNNDEEIKFFDVSLSGISKLEKEMDFSGGIPLFAHEDRVFSEKELLSEWNTPIPSDMGMDLAPDGRAAIFHGSNEEGNLVSTVLSFKRWKSVEQTVQDAWGVINEGESYSFIGPDFKKKIVFG